jgi:hypothetical protein
MTRVKFMLMTFGSAEEMLQTASGEWIRDMIRFMKQLDGDLRASGELLDSQGLVDGSEARTTRLVDGEVVVTEGSHAPARDSLVGYWLLEVLWEGRAIEIASQITAKIGAPIEVRRIGDAPDV